MKQIALVGVILMALLGVVVITLWSLSPESDKLPPSTVPIQEAKLRQTLRGEILEHGGGGASSVVFSSNGKLLVSVDASREKRVKFWDVSTGKNIVTLDGPFLGFSPDGRTLAAGGKLWDMSNGKNTVTLVGPFLGFSPDRKPLASVSQDKMVHLWTATAGKQTLAMKEYIPKLQGEQQYTVDSVVICPNGKKLAVAGTGFVWKESKDQEGGFFSYKHDIAGWVTLLDVTTGKRIVTLEGHVPSLQQGQNYTVTSLAFNPVGRTLAVAGAVFVLGFDMNKGVTRTFGKTTARGVSLFEATTGKRVATLEGQFLAFSPDGKMVASGGRVVQGGGAIDLDGITTWRSGSIGDIISDRNVTAGGVTLSDVSTGKRIAYFEGWFLGFSSDGKTLATASGEKGGEAIRLWEVIRGKNTATLESHTTGVYSVAFCSDGKTLASASFDEIKLWDLPVAQKPDE